MSPDPSPPADRFDVTIRFEADADEPERVVEALVDAFEVPTATAARATGIAKTGDSVEVSFYEVANEAPPEGSQYVPPRPDEPSEMPVRGALDQLAEQTEATVVVPIVRALVAVSAARARAGLPGRQQVTVTVEPSPTHRQEELRHS